MTYGTAPDDIKETAKGLAKLVEKGFDSFWIEGAIAAALVREREKGAALHAALDQCVELLEIIKPHWIDYDHVYSIGVDEARKAMAAALPTPQDSEAAK